jgi:lipoyl(octanoyl) transferase
MVSLPSIRWLATPADYATTWAAMREATAARDARSPDEIWLVEHPPVYTLGQAGKPEHLLNTAGIPVVSSDRGGQVTYHGPGQVVAYVLFDMKRAGYFVREYVHRVESAVIAALADLGLPDAQRKESAPGVYVSWPRTGPASELAKIAALGIKVKQGRTYHGVALNVAMDLDPFLGINPCGYAGLRTVDLASCGVQVSLEQAGNRLAAHLARELAA